MHVLTNLSGIQEDAIQCTSCELTQDLIVIFSATSVRYHLLRIGRIGADGTDGEGDILKFILHATLTVVSC